MRLFRVLTSPIPCPPCKCDGCGTGVRAHSVPHHQCLPDQRAALHAGRRRLAVRLGQLRRHRQGAAWWRVAQRAQQGWGWGHKAATGARGRVLGVKGCKSQEQAPGPACRCRRAAPGRCGSANACALRLSRPASPSPPLCPGLCPSHAAQTIRHRASSCSHGPGPPATHQGTSLAARSCARLRLLLHSAHPAHPAPSFHPHHPARPPARPCAAAQIFDIETGEHRTLYAANGHDWENAGDDFTSWVTVIGLDVLPQGTPWLIAPI